MWLSLSDEIQSSRMQFEGESSQTYSLGEETIDLNSFHCSQPSSEINRKLLWKDEHLVQLPFTLLSV